MTASTGKPARLRAASAKPAVDRAPAVSLHARDRLMLVLLGALTVAGIILCSRLAAPFLPALTWAVALAVIARPMHERISRRVQHRTISAILSVIVVTTIVVLPLVFASQQLVGETTAVFERLKGGGGKAFWEGVKARAGILAPVLEWIDRQWSIPGQVQSLGEYAVAGAKAVWSASVGVIVGGLLTLFFLFYFFRDRNRLIAAVRAGLPLSVDESGRVLQRIDDTIHAMVFGSLGVALIQGVLGGIMFWLLGLPSPLVWAAVMFVCAILPVMGAALVWVPAVLYLWITGESMRALALLCWGGLVISLIDNLLYPILVRNRLRLHTVPVFIAIVGGILLFGAAGLVLGPVVLAVTLALLGIWRDRMRMPAD